MSADKVPDIEKLHEALDDASDSREFKEAFSKAFALEADTIIVIALNSRTNEILFNASGEPVDVRAALRGALGTFLEQHPTLKDN